MLNHIHSFIHSWHFYSAISSPKLHRGVPDYSIHIVPELTRQNNTALQVKNLPKVPIWRLEWGSNMLLSGCKASNLQLSYHAPHEILWTTEHFVSYILLDACVCVKAKINSYWDVCLNLYRVNSLCRIAWYITSITLKGHRKKDRQLIFTTETDSFLSNPEIKAHCEAV